MVFPKFIWQVCGHQQHEVHEYPYVKKLISLQKPLIDYTCTSTDNYTSEEDL